MLATVMPTESFEEILYQTQAHLRAYIAGLGIASHEVDDLAQDVYLEFYKGFDRRPAEASPERWLKGIAKNLCLNHLRKKARRGRLQRAALAELLARVESPVERLSAFGAAQARLEDCVSKLPAGSRRLLTLRYVQELSSQAIAEAVESTAEAVRVTLFRLRGALKECVTQALARET